MENVDKLFNIQDFLQACGKSGCYYLCLAKIATDMGRNLNQIIAGTIGMINDGSMVYDFSDRDDPKNFFINDAESCFNWLTGKKVKCIKKYTLEKQTHPDFVIECWIGKNGYGTKSHFKMANFDPQPNANSTKYGMLESYRCFYLCDK